jgi:thiamine biosynthesis lipoprotein
LFDGFNYVEGVNNIYTINQNAGLQAVQVEPVLLELIKLSKEAYIISDGTVNIALGPVISIWREYAAANGERGIPDYSDLQAVRHLTDISNIIINEEEGSVFLTHEGMVLDVGSIAKGFAIEIAAQKAITAGFASFSLSVGGDIRVAAAPLGGVRDFWSIGVENPESGGIIDAVFVTDTAIFTSGDYHRYFMVEGERFHHIIDPGSLMPVNKYRSVTVVHPEGGMADILTTAAFLLDIDKGISLLEEFGAKGMWVLHDGEIVRTDGFYLINRGK